MPYTDLNRLINFYQPGSLASLKTKFPAEPQRFALERDMGNGAPGDSDPGERNAKLAQAKIGEESVRGQLDTLIAAVRHKMRVSFWLRQGGSIGAVFASLVTAYLVWGGKPATNTTLATAAFAAFGSLTTTLADTVVKSPSGVALASPEEFAKMINARVEVERSRQLLASAAMAGLNDAELDRILVDLNEMALQVMRYTLA